MLFSESLLFIHALQKPFLTKIKLFKTLVCLFPNLQHEAMCSSMANQEQWITLLTKSFHPLFITKDYFKPCLQTQLGMSNWICCAFAVFIMEITHVHMSSTCVLIPLRYLKSISNSQDRIYIILTNGRKVLDLNDIFSK